MTTHDASSSALGYLYQIRWALLEMLRTAQMDPGRKLALETLDDVSWESEGAEPLELIQLKHHKPNQGSLTDKSPDIWRTLKVWMDQQTTSHVTGPQLTLVTTANAPVGSAAFLLRSGDRDVAKAEDQLTTAAETSEEKTKTPAAREQWKKLPRAERLSLLERVCILDGHLRIDDLDAALEQEIWLVAPKDRAPEFLEELDAWWVRVSVDLLRKARATVSMNELKAKIDDTRDKFLPDNLVTIENSISDDEAMAQYGGRPFVKQMEWIEATPTMLRYAVSDFHRAVTQTTEWVDRNLLEMSEFDEFKDALIEEWEIAFDDMLDEMPKTSTDIDKVNAGKKLYRKLRDSAAVNVRPRYTKAFYARGIRHEISDGLSRGWHPDFEELIETLTIGRANG